MPANVPAADAPPVNHHTRVQATPSVATVAAAAGRSTWVLPVFDHTGSVCLVLALIGSAGGFDSAADGPLARTLLAATRRLSWRFGLLEATEAG